jgi:hypothetical protein
MKRCAQCNRRLGLGVRFRNIWNGHRWVHVRFCSARCEAIYPGTGAGQVTVPSGQNSGAGIPGKPGNKSGPTANHSTATTGVGANSNDQRNEGVREQDSAKIPGLLGSKGMPPILLK